MRSVNALMLPSIHNFLVDSNSLEHALTMESGVFAALIVSGTIGRSMIVFLRSISNSILKVDEDDGANETEGNILWSSLGLSFLIAIIFSPFWVAITGYTLCVIQTYCFMAYCNKKIGGVSGNILGANEQISEIMFLLVFSAVYGAL